MENPNLKWMRTAGTPICGNPHVWIILKGGGVQAISKFQQVYERFQRVLQTSGFDNNTCGIHTNDGIQTIT